jgi:hypothetical protein
VFLKLCFQRLFNCWVHLSVGGAAEPIVFEFFWAALPDNAPELIADHDKFIYTVLLKRLSGEQEERTNT